MADSEPSESEDIVIDSPSLNILGRELRERTSRGVPKGSLFLELIELQQKETKTFLWLRIQSVSRLSSIALKLITMSVRAMKCYKIEFGPFK